MILWAIVERGCALSSLSTEDAVAYRAFLRHPAPRPRWVGPARPRGTPEWRPFAGGLSTRSAAYTLSVLLGFPPALATGLVLMGCMPGGTTSIVTAAQPGRTRNQVK